MIALETIEDQYIEAVNSFIRASSFCKSNFLYESSFSGYRNGFFIFLVKSRKPKKDVVLKLDPYNLEIYGSYAQSLNIGFYVGNLLKTSEPKAL